MSWTIEIEQRILALLQAGEGLADVRTWESEVREVLFSGEQLSKGFRADELPAVMVTTALDPTRSNAWTAGEIKYTLPLQVLVITASADKEQARAQCLDLMRALEKPLNAARRSDVVGPNAFVSDELVSSHVIVQDRPRHFGVGNITATILKVVDL